MENSLRNFKKTFSCFAVFISLSSNAFSNPEINNNLASGGGIVNKTPITKAEIEQALGEALNKSDNAATSE